MSGKLTSGIERNVYKAFQKSLEINNYEGINKLISFARAIIRKSLEFRHREHFNQYLNFFLTIYTSIHQEYKQNPTKFKKTHAQYADLAALHIKEIIAVAITLEGKKSKTIEDKRQINEFYYDGFKAYSLFLYYTIMNRDWDTYSTAMNYLDSLWGGAFGDVTDKIREHDKLSRKDSPLEEDIKNIQLLENEISISNKFGEYKNHVNAGIYYWLYLLYDEQIIDLQELKNALLRPNDSNPALYTNITDILFFRQVNDGYFDWGRWDFMQRLSGVPYYPPMPVDWLTKGFIINRIHEGFNMLDFYKVNSDNADQIRFLYEALINDISEIKNSYDRWQPFFEMDISEFDAAAQKALRPFLEARKRAIGSKEAVIVQQPLSSTKLAAFKNSVGKKWEESAGVRSIFEYFKNETQLDIDDKKLKAVGRYAFLAKGKIMFIDGEQSMQIYGLDDIGRKVSRWEDDLFFDVVNKSSPAIVEASSIVQLLTHAIATLRKSGIIPTIILIEPEYTYKDSELIKDTRYISPFKITENQLLPFNFIGYFDEIPLATSYSNAIKNKIIVADFQYAFRLLYKTNPDYYQNRLMVDIRPVSDIQAEERFSQEPTKWTQTEDGIISREDALTLIKTAVFMEVETIIDFEVADCEKFVMGSVTSPLPD
jgi:hypothetical protein